MRVDTLKAVIVYGTCAVLAVGGTAALVFVRDISEARVTVIAGLIAAAVGFLVQGEVQTRTARQVHASVEQGVVSQSAEPGQSTNP